MPVKTGLIRIGNSRGVRLPKPLIEQHGLGDEVELHSRSDGILIRRAKAHPREGWEDDARAMAAAGDDELLFPEPFDNEFDRTEWTWPMDELLRATKSTSSRSTRRKVRKSRRRGRA
jgi:antitoxin MazE